MLQQYYYLCLVLLLSSPCLAFSAFPGARIELSHISSVQGGRSGADIHAPLDYTSGEYIMWIYIGSNRVPISGFVDTGSNLIWTQCSDCNPCFRQRAEKKYNPYSSTTRRTIRCDCSGERLLGKTAEKCCEYNYRYTSGMVWGKLVEDTVILGKRDPVYIAIGCTTRASNSGHSQISFADASGIIGLGRGHLSLIAQLGINKFSHCFNIDRAGKSLLFLGPNSELKKDIGGSSEKDHSTPLVSKKDEPTHYYVKLEKISLGHDQPVVHTKKGVTDMVLVDTGTTYTSLAPELYEEVVMEKIKSKVSPDKPFQKKNKKTCFQNSSGLPDVTLHFQDAQMVLAPRHYVEDDGGVYCLLIREGGETILGSRQMRGMHVFYDLEHEKLHFRREDCSSLE